MAQQCPRLGPRGVREQPELQDRVLLAKTGVVGRAGPGLPVALAADNPTVPCPQADEEPSKLGVLVTRPAAARSS